jgi:hypothetical protein
VKHEWTFHRVSSILHLELNLTQITEIDHCMRDVRQMALIINQMLTDGNVVREQTTCRFHMISIRNYSGHHFNKSERIMSQLQQGIWSVESTSHVRE